MPTLLPRTKAPDFSLTSDENKKVSLSDFFGQNVVIYFYPKDDTPGCTKEACMFAEAWDIYKEKDIIVIGISADSPESHKAFKEKYHLPFILLSDPAIHAGEILTDLDSLV